MKRIFQITLLIVLGLESNCQTYWLQDLIYPSIHKQNITTTNGVSAKYDITNKISFGLGVSLENGFLMSELEYKSFIDNSYANLSISDFENLISITDQNSKDQIATSEIFSFSNSLSIPSEVLYSIIISKSISYNLVARANFILLTKTKSKIQHNNMLLIVDSTQIFSQTSSFGVGNQIEFQLHPRFSLAFGLYTKIDLNKNFYLDTGFTLYYVLTKRLK